MKYRVEHTTRYAYSQPVVLCHNEAHLQPRATPAQHCAESTVVVEPAPSQCAERVDFFGNRVLYFAVQKTHERLVVTATSEVDVAAAAPALDLAAAPAWDAMREALRGETAPEARLARQFTLDSAFAAAAPGLAAYAARSFAPGRPLFEAVADLNGRIHREFTFDPQSTTVSTPLAEVFEKRQGVCQDFAHLAIACLRSLALPARYVSGYLETAPPAGRPKLRGADVSHAWFAAFAPGVGWVDFDPTNDQLPTDRHITTAWGRDYADVAPLKGVIFGGGAHTLEVAVDMHIVG